MAVSDEGFLASGDCSVPRLCRTSHGKADHPSSGLASSNDPQFYWILFICMDLPKVLSPNTMSFVENIETVS